MPKVKPVYSNDEITAAIALAREGKGRKLAVMIKGCPLDDLAKGFSRIGGEYAADFTGISWVLSWCMGAREERARCNAVMRRLRRETRTARRGVMA